MPRVSNWPTVAIWYRAIRDSPRPRRLEPRPRDRNFVSLARYNHTIASPILRNKSPYPYSLILYHSVSGLRIMVLYGSLLKHIIIAYIRANFFSGAEAEPFLPEKYFDTVRKKLLIWPDQIACHVKRAETVSLHCIEFHCNALPDSFTPCTK